MQNNELVRVATKDDVNGFYRLWKLCFGDSDAFCNWLFQNRFFPEYSVCLENEGEILSAMQGVPFTIRVRGKDLMGVMLCGVSTDPIHRKKGYMNKIFTYEMNLLNQKGISLAVHTPAALESYFAYGHYPVADALYIHGKAEEKCNYTWLEKAQWEKLYPLYENNIGIPYSGAVRRTKDEFLRKCEDYAADGGKCIVLKKEGIEGYAFVYSLENEIICPEVVANEGEYDALVKQIFALANGREVSIKLPPDVKISSENGKRTYCQKGVAGVSNISQLLKELEISCPYAIEFFDPVVGDNNGVFSFEGVKTLQKPAIKVEAGHFLRVLVGYASLDEIRPFVTILNPDGYDFIKQILPKCKCYIIDEY